MSLSLSLFFVAAFVFVMILLGSNLKRKKKRIVFFGDSITEFGTRPGGYIAFINELMKEFGIEENKEIINSGQRGNKVYHMLLRLDADVLAHEPKIVVVFVGVNDIWHKQKSGTGTTPETFRQFYETIVHRMHKHNIKLLLCTPAVIGENAAENEEEWKDLQVYGDIIKQIGAEYDVPVVDLHQAFKNFYLQHDMQQRDEGVLTTDGVHLSPEGNRLVAHEIWKRLQHML